MTFTSLPFLFFFSLVFVLNYYMPKNTKTFFLLVMSYLFYGFFDIRFLPYLWSVTIITYLSSRLIVKNQKQKNTFLYVSILAILGILLYFKYSNFLFNLFGLNELVSSNILLPIGISFITFQSIGYVVDIYRDSSNYESDFLTLALFIGFFPQITSGPISRASILIPQIKSKSSVTSVEMESGFYQFLWGLFKKLVLADNFALIANNGFENYKLVLGLPILVSVIAYTLQIYGDFSGYSDMAIGLSKMLGFKLKDNFNSPYFATSIRDFWKRWHISLSTWFRDYVYFPLGGSRVSQIRKYFNLLVTFILSGLWHGANLTFIIWGALHGLFQIIEDLLIRNNILNKFPLLLKWLITFSAVSFAWIFFRANTLEHAFGVIASIFHFTIPTNLGWLSNMLSMVGIQKFEVLILGVSLALLVAVEGLNYFNHYYFYREERINKFSIFYATGLLLLILLFGVFSNSTFIYFNF